MKRLSIPTTASPQCLEVPEGIERSRLGSLHVQPGLTLTVTDGEAAIVLRAVPGVRMRDVKKEQSEAPKSEAPKSEAPKSEAPKSEADEKSADSDAPRRKRKDS